MKVQMKFKVVVGWWNSVMYREGLMRVRWLYRMYSFGAKLWVYFWLCMKNGPWAGCVEQYSRYWIVQFFMNLKQYIHAHRYFVQSVQFVQSTIALCARLSVVWVRLKEVVYTHPNSTTHDPISFHFLDLLYSKSPLPIGLPSYLYYRPP